MTTRTITIEATAKREAMPDIATVEAIARASGEKAGAARAIAKDRASTIRESVTAVDSVQIRTSELKIEESTEMFDSGSEAPYVAEEWLQIKCAPEAAEAVVVKITDAGGSVQTVEFSLSEHVRQDLQDDAQSAAIQRAREKAVNLAAAEGLAVADVKRVATTDVDGDMTGLVDLAFAEHNCDVALTPIAISEAIEVVYELTDK